LGDPRRLRKKYKSPGHPWQKERIQSELPYMGKYGLRNKKEIWRHRTQIARFRQIARSLLAVDPEIRSSQEKILIKKVSRLGLIPEKSGLDDVLGLSIDDIMERRFQTIVLRKGLANSIQQARQLITHGHIAVNGRLIKSPSHLITIEEEKSINYKKGGAFEKKPLVSTKQEKKEKTSKKQDKVKK
jgi:small subunit ribosomal protein S4